MPNTLPRVFDPVSRQYVPSATAPASGVVSCIDYTCSGPWMIERQTMDLTYVRQPQVFVSSTNISLSGASETFFMKGTHLAIECKATYSRIKSTDVYDSSSFQQPQTFQVFAVSNDAYQANPFTLTPSSLGPQGQIKTAQPWIRRRLWLDSDTQTTSSIVGTNFWVKSNSTTVSGDGTELVTYYTPTSHWKDFQKVSVGLSLFQGNPWTFNNPMVHYPRFCKYELDGSYTPSAEPSNVVVELLDEAGQYVRAAFLPDSPELKDYGWYTGWYSTFPMEKWTQPKPQGVPMAGNIPDYDINRHSYLAG